MATGKEEGIFARHTVIAMFLSEIRRLACDPKHAPKPMKPQDFNPFIEKEKPLPVPITALRDVFCRAPKKKREAKPC